jgi:hypothetical protein
MQIKTFTISTLLLVCIGFCLPVKGFAQKDPPPPKIDYSAEKSTATFDKLLEQRGDFMIGSRQGLCGLVYKKRVVIPFEYPRMEFSKNTPFIIAFNQRYRFGLLDTTGKEVLPFEWQTLSDFYGTKLLFAQKDYGAKCKSLLISDIGEKLFEMPFKSIKAIGDGRFIAEKDSTELLKAYSAILNEQMQVIYPFKYNYFDWVNGDWAFAIHYDLKKRGLLHLSRDDLKPIPNSYSNIGPPDENGYLFFSITENESPKIGLMDTAIQVLIAPQFKGIFHVYGTKQYFFSNETSYFALHDEHGKRSSDFIYRYPQPLYNADYQMNPAGAAPKTALSVMTQINRQTWALMHAQKGWILGDSCWSIHSLNDSMILYSAGPEDARRYSLMHLNGTHLLTGFEDMKPYKNETFFALKDKKVTLRNQNGQVIREIDAETIPQIKPDKDGTFFIARKNGLYGILNDQIQPITAYEFSNLDWKYFPNGWLEKNTNKPGFGVWIASGYPFMKDKRVAIDQTGKTLLMVD